MPDHVKRFRQELLHPGPDCRITLMHVEPEAAPLKIGDIELPAGGAVLWYLFPDRTWEVAAAYGPDGVLVGHYTNFIRRPRIETGVWRLTDLYLDVWQPAGGPPRLLDVEDLDAAVAAGHVTEEEAKTVRSDADAVMRSARTGRWPPRIVREYVLDDVPALRLRRVEPGIYYANLVVGRIIAFGIYAFGAVSLTSLAFAALTGAFQDDRVALISWAVVTTVELAVLFGLSITGRLPATPRPRPEEALTERLLFLGTLIISLALFLYPDSNLWRDALVGVYSAIGVFLAIFAVARWRWEERFPGLAVAGIGVCLFALFVLL